MALASKKGRNKTSSLAKRANISYQTKEQGGGGSRIINWRDADSTIQFFQPAIGRNSINIIPFEIQSKNHPLVRNGSMEIGELDYCLDIWTHRNVGPSESSVICLKRTYGKACPICEEAAKLAEMGKKKEAHDLRSSRRVFYNVEDTRRKPGFLQVFEASHFLFEKELIDEARNDEDGEGGFVDFADPENGSVIKFRCSKESRGGFDFNEFKSFQFADREESVDELLEKAISFDKYLNVPSYEQIQEVLYGADEDEDDGEPSKPAKKGGKNPSRDESEDDDDTGEDEDEGDDSSSRVKKGAKRPAKNESEEDEGEDDDEDGGRTSKPVKKGGKAPAKGKCPHGHAFGVDADDFEECEECDLWHKCVGK